MVCFAGLIVFFAPSVIGPMIDDYINKSELDQTLAACKPDEVVYVVFHNGNAKELATFSFTKKQLTGGDGQGGSDSGSWFGGSKSLYYTTRLANGVPYSDDQVRQIKSILATLPAPASSMFGNGSWRDQIHLAFYQGDQLQIYHYPKSHAPPQLADLCQALKIAEHN